MDNNSVIQKLQHLRVRELLSSFSVPKTPRQVEKELGIKKLKLKPLLKKHYLKVLNPTARKGRLYIVTKKSIKAFNLSCSRNKTSNWDIIGWIMASPHQRLVVLKSMDQVKRTSEEIRKRADKYNPHLTRISTKGILKELLERKIIETEIHGRKRYYWLRDIENNIIDQISYLEKKNI